MVGGHIGFFLRSNFFWGHNFSGPTIGSYKGFSGLCEIEIGGMLVGYIGFFFDSDRKTYIVGETYIVLV